MEKQVLVVRNLKTREAVHEVDVTGRSDREVEKIMMGMLINMSPDYLIDDTAAYRKEKR